MAKDVKAEEKKEEEKEKKEQRKTSWFSKVPVVWKIAGIAVIGVKYFAIQNVGGDIKELWLWIAGVLLVWYFIGSEGKRRDTDILSPREAIEIMEKEMKWYKQKGLIPKFAETYVGPIAGLFYNEGMPQHYQIAVEIVHHNSRQNLRALVFAEGPAKGYPTLQHSFGQTTGREPIPVRTPKIFKDLKKYNVDLDKFIFGDKSKP